MRFLLRLLVNAAALAVATWLISGITLTATDTTDRVVSLLIVALIFGVINAIIKPIFQLVTLPLVLLTLGLFLIVINALLLMLTSWLSGEFGLGWQVDGFWPAVWGSIVISIVSFLLSTLVPDKKEQRR